MTGSWSISRWISDSFGQWLRAGYMEQRTFHETENGTPQGGIISPVLANMALDGLRRCIRQHFPKSGKGASTGLRQEV